LVTFSSGSKTVFKNGDLREKENLQSILSKIQTEGSTNIMSGLKRGYSLIMNEEINEESHSDSSRGRRRKTSITYNINDTDFTPSEEIKKKEEEEKKKNDEEEKKRKEEEEEEEKKKNLEKKNEEKRTKRILIFSDGNDDSGKNILDGIRIFAKNQLIQELQYLHLELEVIMMKKL